MHAWPYNMYMYTYMHVALQYACGMHVAMHFRQVYVTIMLMFMSCSCNMHENSKIHACYMKHACTLI